MNKILVLALAFASGFALASDPSPYAGQESRPIKSLSAKEVQALKAGKGMGLGKVAELNQYPGPKHVMDLAEELELSPSQLADTQKNFAEMKVNAIAVGEKLLAAEMKLEQAFQDGTIDAGSLEQAVQQIGQLRAELRLVHLQTHLRQKQIMSDEQIAKYVEHRGYRGGKQKHQKQHMHGQKKTGSGAG